MNVRFSSIKGDFSDIYTSGDPRDHFKALGNYVIPQLAAPALLQLAERLIGADCSYGLDPSGKEDEDFHRAEFFLSRPTIEVRGARLSKIVTFDPDDATAELLEITPDEFRRDLH
jgi:hypothetical protein